MGARIQSPGFDSHGIVVRLRAGAPYLQTPAARFSEGRRTWTGPGASPGTKPARGLGSLPGAGFVDRRGLDDEKLRAPARIRPRLPYREPSHFEALAASVALSSRRTGIRLLPPASG